VFVELVWRAGEAGEAGGWAHDVSPNALSEGGRVAATNRTGEGSFGKRSVVCEYIVPYRNISLTCTYITKT
jgi:hypothetical protein